MLLDLEAMPTLGRCTVRVGAGLAFILLDFSERAAVALGPSSAAELVAGMASFVLGSCLF